MIAAIADSIAQNGWAVCEQFLNDEEWRSLVADIGRLQASNLMRPAGVGRGTEFQLDATVRSDLVYWLDEANLSPPQQRAWNKLEDLRLELNRDLYMGLRQLEAHLTHYGPNGHYAKHVDNFRGQSERRLSCIIYLNQNWQPGEGGELRIYAPDDEARLLATVEPRGGTLACFLSRDIPHEVAVTSRDRFSLTGWFR